MFRYEYRPQSLVPDELSEYDPLVQQLLMIRGIVTRSAAERFLNPNYDEHLHDPFLLTDMEKAVERILKAIAEQEHVVVYSDYDCDGIPGGVLLHDFFTTVGHTRFQNYIPHRHYEGYGFNAAALEKLPAETALIITVDCGSSDHEAVRAAHTKGIDVIVTDHHEVGSDVPPALAFINPKRDTRYPFQGICGAAVAFKLVQATLSRGRERGVFSLKEGWEKWWLDMVGMATIADMMPLVDESRVLARYGLGVLRKSKRPGLQQLLRKAGGSQQHLTEDDIGFTIAPRINAASRMDDPEDAFHMLRTRDEVEAGSYVLHLEKLNNERKGVVASMTKEVKKRIEHLTEIPSVIVMGNPEWRPSLVGLVASTIAEEFSRPTFMWGRDGQGVIKGSCRSEGVTSVVELMESARDAFLAFGGHHASGGFSVHHDAIHTLPETLERVHAASEKKGNTNHAAQYIDVQVALDDIDEHLIATLDMFAPFGEGNPKPLFEIKGVIPREVVVFGKAQNHTKIRLKSKHGFIDAIGFFVLPDQFSVEPKKDELCTLLVYVERSYFMGRSEIRLRLVDVVK